MEGKIMTDRLALLQADVDETRQVLTANVIKVVERDNKLIDLENQAEYLKGESQYFHNIAVKVKRKMWWQNAKTWLMISTAALVVVGLIILIIFV